MSANNGDIKDHMVLCRTSGGIEIRGTLLRLTRFAAVFEIYNPGLAVRMSDVLEDFKILLGESTVYSGRGLISNLLTTGTLLVCEAKLEESGLSITPLSSSLAAGSSLNAYFGEFIEQWQQLYRVRPDFKVVMGDLQSFLSELRIWFEQVELEVRSSPSADRAQLERQVVDELAGPAIKAIDSFIERFEAIATNLEEELHPVHHAYLRRQLHPLLLCSPFAYRSFYKPLGYAGDYEVVDMMIRPPYEGGSLFSKILNVWLLGQAPARAHRNRVEYLAGKLLQEALRAKARGRPARVYNLGCGPAAEIQKLLSEQPLTDHLQFTLLDFNEETLVHARNTLENLKRTYGRSTPIHCTRRSVQQIMKEAGRSVHKAPEDQFDVVYCAGLFDYLSDAVCKRLMNIFYDMLAPGGLLLATNVSDAMNPTRPFRYSMEYILDWHLIYRNGPEVRALAPTQAPQDCCTVIAEPAGVNIFIEVRKP